MNITHYRNVQKLYLVFFLLDPDILNCLRMSVAEIIKNRLLIQRR